MVKSRAVLNGKYSVAVCYTSTSSFDKIASAVNIEETDLKMRQGLLETPVKRFEYYNSTNQHCYGLAFLFVGMDDYCEMIITSLTKIEYEDILRVYDEISEKE